MSDTAPEVTIGDVERAAAAIAGRVVRTPLVAAPRLGRQLGCELWLKLENLQFTGSFKDRGACYKLQLLAEQGSLPGVVAASAGNHAQGVAFHAQRLGLPAVIVMPVSTPFTKIERTEALGAEVVLHGESLAEAADHAMTLVDARGLVFVPPYDDPAIIAGQGTVGLELLADRPDLDAVVVPVGGGGLAAGIALWLGHHAPQVELIGVQSAACPAMYAALRGEPAPELRTTTIAEGIAVKRPGRITRAILARHLDDMVLVDEAALERAVDLLAAQQKVVAEGAGAAGLAALLADPARWANRRVAVVICGGNIDRRLLSTLLLRALARDGKVARLRIEIPDTPGVLARVTGLIGATGADIVDITHQRVFTSGPPRRAELDAVVETHGRAHVDEIVRRLQAAGFAARVF